MKHSEATSNSCGTTLQTHVNHLVGSFTYLLMLREQMIFVRGSSVNVYEVTIDLSYVRVQNN